MRVGRFDSRDLRAGRALLVLLSTAAIGGIVASAFLVRPTPRGGNVWLGRLADAVGAHRVTRARLTSRFTYAACEAAVPNDMLIVGLVCADARPAVWTQSGKLSTLATEMRSAGTADSTSGTYDARGHGPLYGYGRPDVVRAVRLAREHEKAQTASV